MDYKEYFRKNRKKAPKTWAKMDNRWDIKMIPAVMDFVFSIHGHVDFKEKKVNGEDIEEKVWELLKKCRRITQKESKIK